MIKNIILIIFLLVPLAVKAGSDPEPQCKKACLEDGYYSITCDSVCHTDEALGHPHTIANRQYICFKDCEKSHPGKNLLDCVLGCRQAVRDDILTGKQRKYMQSIEEVENILKKQDEKIEQRIERNITSREIKKKRPEPLIIE